jgi:hypothetical protein
MTAFQRPTIGQPNHDESSWPPGKILPSDPGAPLSVRENRPTVIYCSSSASRGINPPANTSLICRGERRCRTVKDESLVTLST